jgi:hypothetical protein
VASGRFSTPIIYKVCVCDSCQRLERSGAVGDACPWEECDGQLVEIEVVPLSVAWKLGPGLADEKVESLHAELAGIFSKLAGPSAR